MPSRQSDVALAADADVGTVMPPFSDTLWIERIERRQRHLGQGGGGNNFKSGNCMIGVRGRVDSVPVFLGKLVLQSFSLSGLGFTSVLSVPFIHHI